MKGHTYKRCPCGIVRDADGKRINCPKKHGSWSYMHELPSGPGGKRRQASRGGFTTERDARRALGEAVAAVQAPGYIELTKLTVADYLDQWLAGKSQIRANTRRSYEAHIRLYLRPGLGHLPLPTLQEVDVERLYAVLPLVGRETPDPPPDVLTRLLAAREEHAQVRPMGPTSIRRVHATLMSALNSAVKRRIITRNPAEHVELPSARRPRAVVWTQDRVAAWKRTGQRPAVAVWTPEQVGAFLDASRDDRLHALFHLIAFRGLRRGEAVGLPWVDVDLAGHRLTISQQVVQLGWATEVAAPKTDSGERVVSLDARTMTVLGDWRARQRLEALEWGHAWTDTGLVFTREDGTGLAPRHGHGRLSTCRRPGRTPPDPAPRPAPHRSQPGPPSRSPHEGRLRTARTQLPGHHRRHLHQRPTGRVRSGSRRRSQPGAPTSASRAGHRRR